MPCRHHTRHRALVWNCASNLLDAGSEATNLVRSVDLFSSKPVIVVANPSGSAVTV